MVEWGKQWYNKEITFYWLCKSFSFKKILISFKMNSAWYYYNLLVPRRSLFRQKLKCFVHCVVFIYLFIYLFWDFSSKGDCFLGSFWRIVLAKLEVNCWFKMFLCIQLECVKQNPVSFISYYTVVTPNFVL